MSPLIETDGERIPAFGPVGHRILIARSERGAAARRRSKRRSRLTDRTSRPGVLAEAERTDDARCMPRPSQSCSSTPTASARPESTVIGFHGQTVLHRPDGSARRCRSAMARRLRDETGIPVVYDLRAGRRRGRRAGRAAGAGVIIARCVRTLERAASDRGAQYRRRRQRHVHRRQPRSALPATPARAMR